MPELPEVETVVRDLRPLLVGRRLLRVQTSAQSLRHAWQPAWSAEVTGSRVEQIRRRGKWIIIDLLRDTIEPAGRPHLLVHLGMTGQFRVMSATEPVESHTHLIFDLSDAAGQLRYRDIRRFGSVELFADAAQVDAHLDDRLGPEPDAIPKMYFRDTLAGSERCLKAILLDQQVVAGVGNIYADESLYEARLHPLLRGCDLTASAAEKLRQAIAKVIVRAIGLRGSTIRDYVGGSGLQGQFQNEFRVYGRTGEPCNRCETAIERIRVGGRSTHFCPVCQPAAT